MTDARREIDSDDFVGLGLVGELITEEARASTALDRDPSMMTHFIGDDCPPDGHRGEAIRPDTAGMAVAETTIADGLAKLDAAVHGGEPVPEDATDGLVGLIFESRSGETPHIVTRWVDTGGVIDVRCTCKAGTFNLPKGCYRMVAARVLWGLPAQGGENA